MLKKELENLETTQREVNLQHDYNLHLFTELECLSPEKTLKIGESIHYNLRWNLHNVKDKTHLKELLTNL